MQDTHKMTERRSIESLLTEQCIQVPMLNLRTIADQHSSQGTCIKLSRLPHSPPQTMLNLMTVTDQHSSQGTTVPNSADRLDTPAKLNAQAGVELIDCS